MDYGLLENDITKAKLGTDERADLEARNNPICVGQGNLGCGLAAVDCNLANVSLQAKRRGVNASDLDATAGNALQFGDEAAADERLKGIRIDVDQ
jgi:hypothetical protein